VLSLWRVVATDQEMPVGDCSAACFSSGTLLCAGSPAGTIILGGKQIANSATYTELPKERRRGGGGNDLYTPLSLTKQIRFLPRLNITHMLASNHKGYDQHS